VYDILGRLVTRLLDGAELSAGMQTVPFDGGNYASGVYFYRLEVLADQPGRAHFTQIKKMVLLK